MLDPDAGMSIFFADGGVVDRNGIAELYHSEVLLDAHVPNRRFQIQGRHAVAETTGTGLPGPGRFASFDVETTASADLLVQFEWRHDEEQGGHLSRELHIWRLDDAGRIAEQVFLTTKVWNDDIAAGPEATRASIGSSLERLGVEAVDLALLPR